MSLPPPAPDSIALVTGASLGHRRAVRPPAVGPRVSRRARRAHEERLARLAEELGSHVEILVNNAGYRIYEPFAESGRKRELNAAAALRDTSPSAAGSSAPVAVTCSAPFLSTGSGRPMEMGAGMGLGEDLINSIF